MEHNERSARQQSVETAIVVLLAALPMIALGQWSMPVEISTRPAETWWGPARFLAAGGDSMWAVWPSSDTYGMLNYLEASCFSGDTWLPNETVVSESIMLTWPSPVRDDSGRPLVAYFMGDYPVKSFPRDTWGIYAVTRTNAGWSAPSLIAQTDLSYPVTAMDIKRGRSGKLGVAWGAGPGAMGSTGSVTFCRETLSGWTLPVCLAAGINEFDMFGLPELISGDTSDFLVAYSHICGDDSVIVSTVSGGQATSRTAWRGRNAHIARGGGVKALSFLRGDTLMASIDRGAGWPEPEIVDLGAPLCDWPATVCDPDGFVWLAWNNVSPWSLLVSYNYGAGWSQPETVLTSDQENLGLGADADGTIHVAWTSHMPGPYGQVWTCRRLLRPGIVAQDRGRLLGQAAGATLVRGVLELPQAPSHKPQAASWLLDISGRKVADLHPGPNDVSRLAPGVYFIRDQGSGLRDREEVSRVVIAR
jgi:hypothetical protein